MKLAIILILLTTSAFSAETKRKISSDATPLNCRVGNVEMLLGYYKIFLKKCDSGFKDRWVNIPLENDKILLQAALTAVGTNKKLNFTGDDSKEENSYTEIFTWSLGE